jgi:hypothetical protein
VDFAASAASKPTMAFANVVANPNPVVSGFPKPSPIRWFEGVSAATSIYAAFRPLFQQVGRWCTSIRFETCPQRKAAASRIHKPPRGASERQSCLGLWKPPKTKCLAVGKIRALQETLMIAPGARTVAGKIGTGVCPTTMTCDLNHCIAVEWGGDW